MHDRVHSGGNESRGSVRIELVVPIGYFMLGDNGQADVVAYHLTDIWGNIIANQANILSKRYKDIDGQSGWTL